MQTTFANTLDGKVKNLPFGVTPPLSRIRVVLLNTFDMAEDSINMDNIFDMMKELSTAYPQQYAELNITSDTCNLNKELDNVCSASLPSFYRERVNTVVFKG